MTRVDRFCSGYEVAKDFQRVVNRRMLPDYFEVIKEPMAFSTIRVCIPIFVDTYPILTAHRGNLRRSNTVITESSFEILP